MVTSKHQHVDCPWTMPQTLASPQSGQRVGSTDASLTSVHRIPCGEMLITVTPAAALDEPVIRNLVQFYAYDFAHAVGWDIPETGRFADAIIDGSFDGAGRHPFLIRVDGRLGGFAIVDLYSHLGDRLTDPGDVRDVAEFFVVRNYRRRGVGETAAHALFDRFGGRWEVRQSAKNEGARAFWRKVIDRYTGGHFDESFHDSVQWRGPVQSFACPPARTDRR